MSGVVSCKRFDSASLPVEAIFDNQDDRGIVSNIPAPVRKARAWRIILDCAMHCGTMVESLR
jgi:hypothetical protein